MYRVNNSARETHSAIPSQKAWAGIKLLMVCLVTASVALALYVRVDSKSSKAAVAVPASAPATLRAAGKGASLLNLQSKQELRADYRGDQNAIQAMRSGQAKARTLASADIDGDAAPDLLAGYTSGGIGIVTIQRGNPEAFAPRDDSVYLRMYQGYNPASLLPTAQTYQVPVPADFLQAGDFNNDSRIDVVVGAQGRDLFLLAGDGQGNLDQPVQVALPGVVTAVAAGQFRAPDGRMDLAVGINGPSGPQVLIYDGADGVTGEPMRLALASPATALEFGEVDDSPFMGLSIATGSEINVVHGWGRKQSPQLESRVERIDTGMNVRGLASGFFMWSREGTKQLAALGGDGTIRIFGRGELNTQPLSDQEMTARARLRLQPKDTTKVDVETLSGWQAEEGESWAKARELATGNSVGSDATAQNLLRSAHISFRGTDDLIVLGGSEDVNIIRQVDTAASAPDDANSNGGDFAATSIKSVAAPATLALPQKLNGWRDLVVMESGSVSMTLVPLAPTATITVDRTDDPNGGALAAASVCGAGGSDCSLRGAVQFANANPGTVISLGTNTYTLNTNGNGGCVIENLATGNTIGDLETNVSTTFTGTGQGSTIINQIGTGTGPTFTGDRVLCMNVNLTAGLTFTFSGMTVAGGRDIASGIGGGGFIGGAKSTTLNLTNVTFANNQTTPGVPQGPVGGGGVAVTGGDMNVTNCTIGAANNPGASRTDLTLGNAATSLSGGGISYSAGDPLGSNGATGTLAISGTTFQRNTSSSASAGGGGLDVKEFNVSASTINIGTSAFTSNQATGTASGGGIINQSATTLNISTTSFTNNSAGNRGGGIYVGGGTTNLNGTVASITFSGNTATTAGSSISAASAVNLSGTNTTIGGDLEITTNGVWTNLAGSAMSPTNFIMTGTASFTGNNSTTNVGGNFNFGSGTFTAGTSLFNFNGTTAQSITNSSAITFFNLTDSNTTQPLTLNNSFAVNNTLSINGANAIFDPVAAAVISGTGTLTGTGTARVRRLGADSFFNQYTITNKTLTSLTVEYIGAGAQTASTTTYNNLKITNASGVTLNAGNTIVNATLTLQTGPLAVSTNTLTINNGITVGTGTLTSAATGTVNYNQSSAGQGVIAGTYGNLTFSAFTKVLASSGMIGVAGTFNPNGVTTGHTIAGSTFDFNGTGAQTVPIFNYNNLTISGARVGSPVVTLAAGTIGVAGAFSHTATGLGTAAAIAAAIAGNTVDFNGSVAQTIGGTTTMNFNNLTFSNVGGVTQTLATINVAGNWTNNGTFTANGLTVVFNGTSGTQTVSGNTTFFNLTTNNAGATTAFGTTNTTVANTFTRTAGTMDPGTGTFTFTGAAGSMVGAGAKIFNNLVINGGATISNPSGGNLTVKANFTNNGTFTQAAGISTTFDNTNATHNFAGAGATTFGSVIINAGTAIDAGSHNFSVGGANFTVTGTFTGNTGTVTFIGTIAQAIDGAGTKNFNNLTINNGGGGSVATSGSSPSVAGLLRIQAGSFTTASNFNNVQIDSGATLAGTIATTMNVTGAWTNNGGAPTSFTSNGNTVNFNGSGAQTIGGSTATVFNNLTIANPVSVTMTQNQTVNGLLTLTNDLTTGANTLTMPAAATSGPATNAADVIGNVKRTGFALTTPLSFGNPFNTIAINSGALPTDINVNLVKSSPVGFSGSVNRTYTITPNGAYGPVTLRLHYLDSELDGNTPETSLNLRRFNGTGWQPFVATSSSTGDATNNWLENNAVPTLSAWTFSTFSPTASGGTITGRIVDAGGAPVEGAVVRLNGTQTRKFITDANGVYRFEQVETSGFYTVTPSRANYTFTPASRDFSQIGETTEAAFAANAASSGLVNPLDTPEYFVRQNYLDFLGREPDEAGFNFWSDQILSCGGDTDCVDSKRTHVSAAYFLSIEFQETGGLVDGLYRASFGRRPSYSEFKPDAAAVAPLLVVNSDGWQTALENGKTAFVDAFVQRAAFQTVYGNLSNDAYVDALIANTGVSFTSAERNALVSGLGGGMTRAAVLRQIVEDADFVNAKRNSAFVMMEYFGYLRREPDAAGFDFWLGKLNHFNGNFEQAEMVRSFIVSGEYRQRFPK